MSWRVTLGKEAPSRTVCRETPALTRPFVSSAGCFNSEGEFNQAIQEYTLALQHDEKENAGGFREKRRIGMHESAEHLIRKTMGGSVARTRGASHVLEPPPRSDSRASFSVLEGPIGRASSPRQEPTVLQRSGRPRSESVPGKRPRRVVQVRVNLSEFAGVTPSSTSLSCSTAPAPAYQQALQKAANPSAFAVVTPSEVPKASCFNSQDGQTQAPRGLAVRAVPKTVRRVTVAL
jgi:hypothetical protein